VQLNALFCCFWRNVEASCHKHFVVVSGNQHRRLLPAVCHNLRHAGRAPPVTAFTKPACCSVNTGSRTIYRLGIAIFAYPTCIRHPHYCYAVWHGKTRMAWLADGKKMKMFIRFDTVHERDRHTQRQTHRQTHKHRMTA